MPVEDDDRTNLLRRFFVGIGLVTAPTENRDRRPIECCLKPRPIDVVAQAGRRPSIDSGDPVVGGNNGVPFNRPLTDHLNTSAACQGQTIGNANGPLPCQGCLVLCQFLLDLNEPTRFVVGGVSQTRSRPQNPTGPLSRPLRQSCQRRLRYPRRSRFSRPAAGSPRLPVTSCRRPVPNFRTGRRH